MTIWIVNHHALTPEMGGGTRHFDFGKELVRRGHQVAIFASSFHYSKHKEMRVYGEQDVLKESLEGVEFFWFKTPAYFSNGVSRVKNMLVFLWKIVRIVPVLDVPKPDVIIGSSVHLFAVYGAYRLSRKYRVPFIMEVRDLWPKTLIDMGMSKWHPFILLLGWLERFLYAKADKIISNLPYAYEYIEAFVPRAKIAWISNGVDLKMIPYYPKERSSCFTVSYTGALGIANSIDLLIEAAERLKDYPEIVFKIVGEGTQKHALKALALAKKLDNVIFEDMVPKEEVFQTLLESDVLYFSLKESPVFNYGISSNKLFDYMAAGRVVVFSAKAKNNVIEEAQAGYSIVPNHLDALVDTLLTIYRLPHETRVAIGENGRAYIKAHYCIETLVSMLEALLKNEIGRYNVEANF